jgi:hypothetical protein
MGDGVDPVDVGQQVRTGRRRVPVWILAGAAVLVVVGGFFIARSLWWSLRPTPEFPSLVAQPDDSLVGTVAFIRPFPENDCVWIVAAAGGEPQELACIDGGAGSLEWLPDGRLQSTRYQGGEGTSDTGRWVIDVTTGEVETVPADEIPPQGEPPTTVVGPDGERVETVSERGRLTMTMTVADETRTLLSVGAPDTYTFGQPVWNPDGEWFVVKDDLDHLLLVTTADDSTTRVLVEGGYGQAVTSDQILGSAGS